MEPFLGVPPTLGGSVSLLLPGSFKEKKVYQMLLPPFISPYAEFHTLCSAPGPLRGGEWLEGGEGARWQEGHQGRLWAGGGGPAAAGPGAAPRGRGATSGDGVCGFVGEFGQSVQSVYSL